MGGSAQVTASHGTKSPLGWEVSRHRGAAGWPRVQDQSGQGSTGKAGGQALRDSDGRGQQGEEGLSK